MSAQGNKVSGTTCNDAYQKFMDKFVALNKEISELYQKAQSDTTLTEDQRKDMENNWLKRQPRH